MRNHYLKTHQLDSNNVAVTPTDKVFISKIISITDTHLAEPDYSIESLARDVGFSHSQLIRKLESLTGLTPSLFIRSRRLIHAKQLLDQKAGNISQIAYDCGFNNLSYFSRSFKDSVWTTSFGLYQRPALIACHLFSKLFFLPFTIKIHRCYDERSERHRTTMV